MFGLTINDTTDIALLLFFIMAIFFGVKCFWEDVIKAFRLPGRRYLSNKKNKNNDDLKEE